MQNSDESDKAEGEKGDPNSDTDTCSESEALIGSCNDHNYCEDKVENEEVFESEDHAYHSETFQKISMTKKKRGPITMEKKQIDFQQYRNAKLRKVDLFIEKCNDCNKSFTSVVAANKHVRLGNCCSKIPAIKKPPLKNTTCALCNEKFANRKSYRYHIETTHDEKNLECVHCGRLFKRNRDLQRHKDEQHKGDPVTFKCKFCDFVSKRNYNLKKHVEKFHETDENDNQTGEVSRDQPAPVVQLSLRETPNIWYQCIPTKDGLFLVAANKRKVGITNIIRRTDDVSVKGTEIISLLFDCSNIHLCGANIVVVGGSDCGVLEQSSGIVFFIVFFFQQRSSSAMHSSRFKELRRL